MGVRSGRRLELTACAPLVDRHVASEAACLERKEGIRSALERYVSAHLRTLGSVEVRLNNLDRRGAGTAGMHLSVLGTSAEHGDSGQEPGFHSRRYTATPRPRAIAIAEVTASSCRP